MDIKQKKQSFTWVWVAATIVFCVFFTTVLIPGAAAQGNMQPQARDHINTIQAAFDFILRNYIDEVDPNVLFEGAMHGLFNALEDQYSSFLSEADMASMGDTTIGTFGGVGLSITQPTGQRADGRPRYVEVIAPIEGTPGWRAGISAGDFIKSIDGVETDTLTMDEVLGKLRGSPGADVNLIIKRGEHMEFPLTITRAVIEVPTVRYAMIGDTGFLRVITFTPLTVARTRDAINYFKENDFQNLVLDLRNNSGGRLDAAIGVANLFLDGGVIVRTRSRIPSENRDHNATRSTFVPPDIPIVVLIDRGSASGAEIVAGALKDRNRAYLVGENTFGKGSVQQVQVMNNVGFRLTTARYFTPSYANIDIVGIPPDREVPLPRITEEDAANLNNLINANLIPIFAAENPQAAPAQIEAFAQTLAADFNLDLSLLTRIIRNELNRSVAPPVYDLENDIQLQEAINILRGGTFQYLLQNARSLIELQEEAEERAAQAG
ncbi:MAG: S41 family peptidase [Treponema sp.]|nr:S41 family peptidase [Treponema sp.]